MANEQYSESNVRKENKFRIIALLCIYAVLTYMANSSPTLTCHHPPPFSIRCFILSIHGYLLLLLLRCQLFEKLVQIKCLQNTAST